MAVLISLLGRRDTPTDGIEDYCHYLGCSLARQGIELQNVRVPWIEEGSLRGLARLWRESSDWRGNWILLQYTALAWSRRGFPFPALAVLAILRLRGLRCAVVFHDSHRQHNSLRSVDRFRGACQDWVIRTLHKKAAKSIFADAIESIDWLPKHDPKAAFVSIGANIPDGACDRGGVAADIKAEKTVAVFCVSGAPYRRREIDEIAYAVRSAASNGVKMRLVLLGRGTPEAQQDIDDAFKGARLEVSNLGLQSAEEVRRILCGADAMLCVRGKLYPRRGSAIAGVACGLPIIGYSNEVNIFPLDRAGVKLVPYGDREALAGALLQVLTDSTLREQLSQRSIRAQEEYFSWDVIAGALVKALDQGLTRT